MIKKQNISTIKKQNTVPKERKSQSPGFVKRPFIFTSINDDNSQTEYSNEGDETQKSVVRDLLNFKRFYTNRNFNFINLFT